MNNAPETKELLEEQGGYAFTHVCKWERTNESLYSLDEARSLLEAFSEYLSFARGIRVAPIFLTGYDEAGKQVWEEWPIWSKQTLGKMAVSGLTLILQKWLIYSQG